MTDLDKFIELYKKIGLALDPSIWKGGYAITIVVPRKEERTTIEGYSGFTSELYFDTEGNFLKQAIYE